MASSPARPWLTATRRPRPVRRVAFLSGSGAPDPTYRAVFQGLASEYARLGWAAALGAGLGTRSVLHLHLSGHVRPGVLRVVRRGLRRGARLVLTFQDLAHPDMRPLSPRQRRAVRELVRSAAAVTALDERLRARVCAAFPEARPKASVIGNGVGPQWFRREARERASGLEVVAAARLSPYKGIDILLWAFRDLADRHPDARLIVCGRDFQRGHFQGLARRLGLSGRVAFLGQVSPERLRGLLSRARFLVSASRSETCGMAVLEALAAGAPVLATRTGAAARLVHGREAFLVPAGDPRALGSGMLRLWKDGPLRRRLSRGSRRAASARLWRAQARRYAALYARALAP